MSRPMQREASVASSQQGLTLEEAFRSRSSPDTDSSSGTTSESWTSPRPVKFTREGFCGTGVIFTARTMLAAAFALSILGFSFLGLAAYLLIRSPHKTTHLDSSLLAVTPQPHIHYTTNSTMVVNKSRFASNSSQNARNKTSNTNSSNGKEPSVSHSDGDTSPSYTKHVPNRKLDHVHGRHPGAKARHHEEALLMADGPDLFAKPQTKHQHNRPTSSTVPPSSFLGRLWEFVSMHNDDDADFGDDDA